MFHAQLRQFPNVARSFNLTREELDARILLPWAAERAVLLDDRRFTPQKAKLTIYEGPRLRPGDMGLGRGWANATRSGDDVTGRLLEECKSALAPDAPASVRRLKDELLEHAAHRPLGIGEALKLAAAIHAGRRVSEQLALTEQSIWELLHQRGMRMLRGEQELGPEEWEPVLLARETWTAGDSNIRLARTTSDS